MDIQKITNGELNVLEVLWENGEISASDIVKKLKESINWNRNTTYTFINRLVEKGIVERKDPNFICTALFTREQVALSESKMFLNKMFKGSLNSMVANFIENEELSKNELDEILDLINKKGDNKK